MKQIKTVCTPVAEPFDNEVNAALADGWTLTKRYILGSGYFVAEMEKENTPKETIPQEARNCANCFYARKEPKDEPCCACERYDKWEAGW